MSKPVVFVIGATGIVGNATVSALAAKYTDKVEIRAGVRNPDKADKLKAIAGITIVKAEMGKKDELVNTFKGVNALYIVTPAAENRAELAITTSEAAKEAGVKAVVVVSGITADLIDTPFGLHFSQIEDQISALGVPYTFLRLPYFVENYWSFKDSIVGEGKIYGPFKPDIPFTVLVVEDLAKATAAILVDPTKHANKTYDLVSYRQKFGEVAEAFSKALGKEVTYVRIPYEAARQRFLTIFPEWRVNGMMVNCKLLDKGLPNYNVADISAYYKITGEQPTDLNAWLAKYSGGFHK